MTELMLLQIQGLLESAIEHQSIDALDIAKGMVDRMLSEKSMTVREAFSLAFGEVPEGATCHAWHWRRSGEIVIKPTYYTPESTADVWMGTWCELKPDEGTIWHVYKSKPSPDISNRPAESFIGFFGEKYDKVVQP